MGKRVVVVLSFVSAVMFSLAACGSSTPAVVPADFEAEVEVERDKTVKVDGTDLKIKVTRTGKIILDDGEISEAGVVFSGIGDELETWMEDSGENSVVEYGGYAIELRSVNVYGDPKSASFDITAGG